MGSLRERFDKLGGDIVGVARVTGASTLLRWLGQLLIHARAIVRSGNLQAADEAMGTGPFRVQPRGAQPFRIRGSGAFSGIREMYARDTYRRNGILDIADGDSVLDLGSNMGNFTNLALACGAAVRVTAVEPNRQLNGALHESVSLNPGFAPRVRQIQAFLGEPGELQRRLVGEPQYAGARWLSESELILDAGLDRIDFLKCDIEGGEFGLLVPGCALLGMTRKLAIEVHSFAGDVDAFLAMLRSEGFRIDYVKSDPDGTATALARKI